MTTFTLPPDIEAWASAEVAAGRAASVEAFVTETLRDTFTARSAFATMIADAVAEGHRDGWVEADVVIADLDIAVREA